MRARSAIAALLVLSIPAAVSAQTSVPSHEGGTSIARTAAETASRATPDAAEPAPDEIADTRTQYPVFLRDSYFSIGFGTIRYPFSQAQLEPGYHAESIDIPHLAARVDLFGRRLFEHLSAEVTYIRPARFVVYNNVNGDPSRQQVSTAFGGVMLVGDAALTRHIGIYGEGGLGITSRSAIKIDGATALKDAQFSAMMLGAGLTYHATPNVDLVLGATYSPGRRGLQQPSMRLFTTGLRYRIKPLPPDQVAENRDAGFVFPKNVARLGYTTNQLGYGLNTLFSRDIPIFWGGRIETRSGLTLDVQHNLFHAKKRFAVDVGASASYWKSGIRHEVFRTLSVYPLFRFFLVRRDLEDVYATYSVAGPTYLTRSIIDGHDAGARFTFQDMIAVGAFFGRHRRFNGELGIKHYSNGNIFTRNAAIKVPLTLSLGITF